MGYVRGIRFAQKLDTAPLALGLAYYHTFGVTTKVSHVALAYGDTQLCTTALGLSQQNERLAVRLKQPHFVKETIPINIDELP